MESTSTLQGLADAPTSRRGRNVRYAGFAIGVLLLAAGFLGTYGPSHETVSSSDGQYTLTLTYGSVVRSGQAVPLTVRVHHPGGFDRPVTLVFDAAVFTHLDFQNWYPNPSTETGGADTVTYAFDPPDGDTLKVMLDARVAPTQWVSRNTYFLALDVAGAVIDRVHYTMLVMP